MDLAVNSVSALPFYGLVMCRDIEQNLMYSLLFLYPVLNNCTCFFVCLFCGGGAVIWSRLFSNVKYEYVGLRYLANPRKTSTGKIHPVTVCSLPGGPPGVSCWSPLSALGLRLLPLPPFPVSFRSCCLFPQEAVPLESDPSGKVDPHPQAPSQTFCFSETTLLCKMRNARVPTFPGVDTEPYFKKRMESAV